MRTIHRDIVGAFIFSADNKVLLGYSTRGVYEGKLVVPGGGIDDDETKLAALKREVLEETGIDVSNATISEVSSGASGESEKVLKGTNECVLVKMNFDDYEIRLKQNANEIIVKFEDDYGDGKWYTAAELKDADVGPPTEATLLRLGFIED